MSNTSNNTINNNNNHHHPPPPPAPPPPSVINASTSSVRRNLFHAHLSRRPASDLPSQSTTHLTTNNNNRPPKPSSSSHRHHSHSHSHSPPFPPYAEIIARDPQTNRPLLPSLPTLPPHLRLSSSTSAAAGDPPHPDRSDSSSAYAAQLELEDALREKEDKERIEKSLVEMMYRSRNRAHAAGHGHGHATRGATTTTVGGSSSVGGGGGGGTIGTDGEEVLALIQASLRKKAGGLEDDRWMFQGEG